MPAPLGKTGPVDALIGVAFRWCVLIAFALVAAFLAVLVLKIDGVPSRPTSRAAMHLAVPIIISLLSFAVWLRLTFWLVLSLLASERQHVLWTRGIGAEMVMVILGGFCVGLSLLVGFQGGLGPFPLIITAIGLGFLANPHAVRFDGERRRVTLSGLLWASTKPYESVRVAPLLVTQRGAASSWHVGLSGFGGPVRVSLPTKEHVAQARAAQIAARTGLY